MLCDFLLSTFCYAYNRVRSVHNEMLYKFIKSNLSKVMKMAEKPILPLNIQNKDIPIEPHTRVSGSTSFYTKSVSCIPRDWKIDWNDWFIVKSATGDLLHILLSAMAGFVSFHSRQTWEILTFRLPSGECHMLCCSVVMLTELRFIKWTEIKLA